MTGTAGQHLATSPTTADSPPALPLAGSTGRPLRARALALFPAAEASKFYTCGIPSHKFLARPLITSMHAQVLRLDTFTFVQYT